MIKQQTEFISHVNNYNNDNTVKNNLLTSSWTSVVITMILVVVFYQIAEPFRKKDSELRRTKGLYFNLMVTIYVWLTASIGLTITFKYTNHYNEIIAAALFFPMLFGTIANLMGGRFVIRCMYYAYHCMMTGQWFQLLLKGLNQSIHHHTTKVKHDEVFSNEQTNNSEDIDGSDNISWSQMVAFQRPFRKLFKQSLVVTTCLCLLFARCWSREYGAFDVQSNGFICKLFFMPFSSMSSSTFNKEVNDKMLVEQDAIWLIWISKMLTLLFIFGQDEFSGYHNRSFDRNKELRNDDSTYVDKNHFFWRRGKNNVIRPNKTLEMVPWYTIFLVGSIFDILVQLKIFVGRFDARMLQPTFSLSSCKVCCLDNDLDEEPASSKFSDVNLKGKLFNFSRDEDEFWFDFMADCGDGFNSSYHVARMLAQPSLSVIRATNKKNKNLPRGKLLILGGDLAYPFPTKENYEQRFFRPFEDAMPPPPSFRRSSLSIRKPPFMKWEKCSAGSSKSETKIDDYEGPMAFAVPGNHDWFDGLATFTRYIISRDWLGGWTLPQESSYFAIHLPHGWWLFGMDLGLSRDIDIQQFRYFAWVAREKMKSHDAVILVVHEPSWILEADDESKRGDWESNLRELMEYHLKGRIRLRLSGDLHHYTRHTVMLSQRGHKEEKPHLKRSLSLESGRKVKSIVPNLKTENLPELVVAGGGGAFLHPTHTFEKNIQVNTGNDFHTYTRVCAYPHIRTSRRLAWLNIGQFRNENWRLDMFWAFSYFFIASSMFPLCGIYADFREAQVDSIFEVILWLASKIIKIMTEIILTGRVSVLTSVLVLISTHTLMDTKLKPLPRFLWGATHGLLHISAALICLVLIQSLVEWSIYNEVVMVVKENIQGKGGIDLAFSISREYTLHFSSVFESSPMPIKKNIDRRWLDLSCQFLGRVISLLLECQIWLYNNVPILSTTLRIFDLPGFIAREHDSICQVLCEGSSQCMFGYHVHQIMFQKIERSIYFSYLASVFMFFLVLAIPTAAVMFGTWLSLSMNIFNTQWNEGFSSLRIQHWKNFVRLHVTSSGELELFAIGLNRVPKKWVQDDEWDGKRMNNYHSFTLDNIPPSFNWTKPSRWVSSSKTINYNPRLIDHTIIHKRPVCTNGNEWRRSRSVERC